MNSCALDISDKSIKYGELLPTSMGLRLGRYGQEAIPPGVIVSGKIENEKELIRILKALSAREHLHFVRVSLPEEQMYLFTLSLPKESMQNLRETILLQLEEHIPLPANETVFDYDVVSDSGDSIFVEVLAISTPIIESYISIFKNAGLVPLSFELEAQAIARAVIAKGDPSSAMIVDFGEARTGVSIASNGRVFFTTTLDIGGINLTNTIAKNFSISFEEAEKMKRKYGLNTTLNTNDIFPIILSGISVLRDELDKQYVYWKTHDVDGKKNEAIQKIILCGGDTNLAGLANYLETSMGIKVENANSWVNITDMKMYVPEMSFEESFGYATVLGLCLGDFADEAQTVINVLPDGEKKLLRKEYWMRLGTMTLSLIALAGVMATLLALPSYFFSISKLNLSTSRLEAFNNANPEIATNDLDTAIADTNAKLVLLSSKKTSREVSNTLEQDLFANKPKGITLSQILYKESTPDTKVLELHGKAINRSTLRDYKSQLDANPDFKKVDLPISDYLEPVDINFTISILMK
jgi:type IV pilus assembly protein PilM